MFEGLLCARRCGYSGGTRSQAELLDPGRSHKLTPNLVLKLKTSLYSEGATEMGLGRDVFQGSAV